MKGKAGPSSKELLTVADAEKFLANSEHSIVGLWLLTYLFTRCNYLFSFLYSAICRHSPSPKLRPYGAIQIVYYYYCYYVRLTFGEPH